MSEQERHAAIGKAMSDYAKAKQDLAALLRTALSYSQALNTVAAHLQTAPEKRHPPALSFSDSRFIDALEQYPPREAISQIAEEIQKVIDQKRELRQSLADMGFEPKD